MHPHPGQFDPWRTDRRPDEERLREMAQRIEMRGKAPEEIAARKTYLDVLDIQPGQRVLDVGCGTGVVTRDIARRVQPGGSALGVDPNPHLLQVARELAPPDLSIELQSGDATNLPVDSASFDVVVCVTVLEHMPEPQRAIPELVRAVRPGGRIGILCGDQESFIVAHPDRDLTRRIVASFADAGFANPWIGRYVPRLLEQAGIRDVQVRGFITLDRDATNFAGRAAQLRAEVVASTSAITAQERDRWTTELTADPAAFLAGSVYIFSWGVKAD